MKSGWKILLSMCVLNCPKYNRRHSVYLYEKHAIVQKHTIISHMYTKCTQILQLYTKCTEIAQKLHNCTKIVQNAQMY